MAAYCNFFTFLLHFFDQSRPELRPIGNANLGDAELLVDPKNSDSSVMRPPGSYCEGIDVGVKSDWPMSSPPERGSLGKKGIPDGSQT